MHPSDTHNRKKKIYVYFEVDTSTSCCTHRRLGDDQHVLAMLLLSQPVADEQLLAAGAVEGTRRLRRVWHWPAECSVAVIHMPATGTHQLVAPEPGHDRDQALSAR